MMDRAAPLQKERGREEFREEREERKARRYEMKT
jgi:hypothetical protein